MKYKYYIEIEMNLSREPRLAYYEAAQDKYVLFPGSIYMWFREKWYRFLSQAYDGMDYLGVGYPQNCYMRWRDVFIYCWRSDA